MKHIAILAAFLAGLITGMPTASADWQDDVSGVLIFAAGVAAGLVVHEAGHEIAARAYGEKLDWEDGKWICRYPCNHLSEIAVAGNLTTAIVGEAILHTSYSGAFVDGMQAFNSINPIAYAIQDARTPGGHGDYSHVNDGVEIAIAIHAATIGYRHFSKRKLSLSPQHRGVRFNYMF